MVKKRVYTVSHINGHLVLSYDDYGVKPPGVSSNAGRSSAAPQQWNFFRSIFSSGNAQNHQNHALNIAAAVRRLLELQALTLRI